MKTVLIPEENRADLEKVNDSVKKAIEFIPVSDLDEVLAIALEEKLEPVKKDAKNNKRKAVKGEPDKQSSAVYCRKG